MLYSTKTCNALLSVRARDGLGSLHSARNEAKAVFVPSRVCDAVEPDSIAAGKRTRASLEASVLTGLIAEDKIAVVVNGEAGALRIAAWLLGTGSVLNNALTHATAIDKELLGWVLGV